VAKWFDATGFRKKSVSPVILASEARILPFLLQLFWHRDKCVEDMKQRFDEVIRELEKDRQLVDEDLRALGHPWMTYPDRLV
jgi:hypothetical protein